MKAQFDEPQKIGLSSLKRSFSMMNASSYCHLIQFWLYCNKFYCYLSCIYPFKLATPISHPVQIFVGYIIRHE